MPGYTPPMGPRPLTEFVQIYSVQSADSPHPLGFVCRQSPGQMTLAWPSSQGSAGAWNPWAGSNSHQSTSESHSPYNPGGFRIVRQQNPRPIAAASLSRSQDPAGIQNAWVQFSQVYLLFLLSCASVLLKTIGLPWPLRSGKRLSYVAVKQSTEHKY